MLNLKETKYDVGVIMGRFQVPYLHEAHVNLIQSVIDRHTKVIIFLGVPPTVLTRNNPLDFEMRKQMILTRFPEVNVLLQNDNVSNAAWSKALDNQITCLVTHNQSVVLYGGRDSFKPHYQGKFPVLEFENEGMISGTVVRKEASVKAINSPDFRAGVIWSVYNRFPTVYTTVDIAIFNSKNEILLAKKPNEKEWRFVGGFSDPDDDTFEMAAKREVAEETGLEVADLEYVGSFKVSDWRYEKELDKIKTILFKCKYVYGAAKAQDDIENVKWFDFSKINLDDIVLCHRPLMKKLLEKGN